MDDTNTKITVSSINEINTFNLERIITIAGEIEDIFTAESEISAKLRTAYESDIQAMAPQSVMFPGLHPAAMMSTAATMPSAPIHQANQGFGMPHPHHQSASGPSGHGHNVGFQHGGVNRNQHFHPGVGRPMGGPGGGNGPAGGMTAMPRPNGFDVMGTPHFQNPNASQTETTYLYVPNISVGAIIGSKGSYIKNIIKFSGASVKIAQQPGDVVQPSDTSDVAAGDNASFPAPPSSHGSASNNNNHNVNERRITVLGNPESQWKAQFLIFDKIREESFNRGVMEEVRLTVEILVPVNQVGRIIGKGGSTVKELQRLTGAVIKLPEQGTSTGEETPVHLTGVFYAVQVCEMFLPQG